MAQEKKLEVRDLRISFRTDNGLVQAVRDVSFDLYNGETLCIVGESGSGKSVTSRAIMGILANNAIVEHGSIIYEGENLLDVSEDEFHKIRGHKIGMIFQDPLSSLNPIMRIGKQITEATLINANKLKQKYEDLISKESMAYKNAIAHANIVMSKARNKYNSLLAEQAKKLKETKEQISQSANPDAAKESYQTLKFNLKEESLAAKKELNEVIASEKATLKTVLPGLKQNLNEKKKSARAEVKAYKQDLQTAYQNALANLNAKYPEKNEQYKKELELLKQDYINKTRITRAEAKKKALQIMQEVGIPFPEKRYRQYPFEFSGGMRQRIVIAIALTASPDVLICDEPTTALDVTIQAQILELINRLKRERNLSCIFITHDLGVVANMADRVAVMYAGKIVEYGKSEEIFFEPKHPYTWALLSSIPDIDSKERLDAIPGTPPDMIYPPKGDAFALRSRYAMEIDYKYQPPFFKVSDTHYAATWLLHPDAPKVEMPKIVSERIAKALKDQNVKKAKAKKKVTAKEEAPNE